MVLRYSVVLIWLFAMALSASIGEEFQVTDAGRNVQIDGFLLEWPEDGRKTFGANSGVFFDAVSTPEGVAGYFHTTYTDTCSQWEMVLYPSLDAFHRNVHIRLDSLGRSDSLYTVYVSSDSSPGVTAEWVVPWSALDTGNAGSYTIGVTGYSRCGRTLDGMRLTGSFPAEGSAITTRVKVQFFIIAVLLAVYLILRAHAAKLTRKKAVIATVRDSSDNRNSD